MIKKLSKKSELLIWHTTYNHSLWPLPSHASRNGGKVIAETSGHESLKALRSYECTSQEQQQMLAVRLMLP